MQNRDRRLARVSMDAAGRRVARHVSLTVTVVSLATVLGAGAVFIFRLFFGEVP